MIKFKSVRRDLKVDSFLQVKVKTVSEALKFLGFVGSLRKGSYNKALMRTAMQLLPKDVTLEVFDISGFPLFNQDSERTPPPLVSEFKARIREADAILIASPEYILLPLIES
jgi:chromate reductase